MIRWIVGIAVTDDVNRRGDRFMLEPGAVGWKLPIPLLMADRPTPIGTVQRLMRPAGRLLFTAALREEAPFWREMCTGECTGVAIGFNVRKCHRNAFGGLTFDRWRIEDIALLPPGWPRQDRGAQIMSVFEDVTEVHRVLYVGPEERKRTPRPEVEIKRLLEGGRAVH